MRKERLDLDEVSTMGEEMIWAPWFATSDVTFAPLKAPHAARRAL